MAISSEQREQFLRAIVSHHGCSERVAEALLDDALGQLAPLGIVEQAADLAEPVTAVTELVTAAVTDPEPWRNADQFEAALAEPWHPPAFVSAQLADPVTPDRDAVTACKCGCGKPVTPPRQYASNACRQRAHRARQRVAEAA